MVTSVNKENTLKSFYEYYKFKVKFYIKNYVLSLKKESNNQYDDYKGKKKFIVMQTPTHGNLGDQAIAYAQRKFIIDNFKGYLYVEVPFEDVIKDTEKIKSVLGSEDIIGIHGGGNMGDLYLNEEYLRRYIIKKFKGNKIISFPQTFSFSKTPIGKMELKSSIKVYTENKDLLIIARETQSFEAMKQYFNEDNVILTPDIVLYLNEKSNLKREGIVTCFRNDKEKVINNSLRDQIINKLKQNYGKVTISDTFIHKKINLQQRSTELGKIWDQFRSSELVITDRLHGMIFGVITKTPCIVFKNSNHKIECTYKNWLHQKDYIKFINLEEIQNGDEFLKIVEVLIQKSNNSDNEEKCFREKYNSIKSYILGN
jgi:pyruvyl transferase EpsI